ncbi:hypothetical protein AAC387_Pa06g0701 [Persea americana]
MCASKQKPQQASKDGKIQMEMETMTTKTACGTCCGFQDALTHAKLSYPTRPDQTDPACQLSLVASRCTSEGASPKSPRTPPNPRGLLAHQTRLNSLTLFPGCWSTEIFLVNMM